MIQILITEMCRMDKQSMNHTPCKKGGGSRIINCTVHINFQIISCTGQEIVGGSVSPQLSADFYYRPHT